MLRFNMPKLRLYQQIIIAFGLIVLIPLLGVSFIIYNINQHALKRELAHFTEQNAEALYKDFSTEMSWQRRQIATMSAIFQQDLKSSNSLESAGRHVFALDEEFEGVGVYDANGHLINATYRDFSNLTPELRLPDVLGENPLSQPFQVLYFTNGSPQDSPYYLRSISAVSGLPPIKSDKGQASAPRYYAQLKGFSYLKNLVHSNQTLYDAFYIVDKDGYIIAGPEGATDKKRIGKADLEQFRAVKPGVTHEFLSPVQTSGEKSDDEDDGPGLRKVIVKMPEINWGIIIESPYRVKQTFINRAGTQTIFLIVGCLVVVILLAIVYVYGVSRNFRQLIKGIKAMGEGNYYRRIRLITNFFTPYEIVYLTLEFNRMARKTADSWQAIQEANEKLAKLDEFKSNLIDTVSHELRTPLTNIKGYTSRLLRYDATLDSDTRLKSLRVVKQQADRLSRLVEDLLVIPDLERAGLRVFPDQVALPPLIDNCVQFIQAKEDREIAVSDIPEEANAVLADPDRLEQILLNLLDNAVKYSEPGTPIGVNIEVLPQETDADGNVIQGDMVALTVSNKTDPKLFEGMENLDILFEKFQRMDDSLIRTTRGSGLGLFITKGLVEAMGGEIRITYSDHRFHIRFTVPVYTGSPAYEEDEALTP